MEIKLIFEPILLIVLFQQFITVFMAAQYAKRKIFNEEIDFLNGYSYNKSNRNK